MQLAVHTGQLTTAVADLLVVGLYADQLDSSSLVKTLDRALGGALRSSIAEQDFRAKPLQALTLHTLGKLRAKRISLLGLGDSQEAASALWVDAGAEATRMGNAVGARQVLVAFPKADAEIATAAARGALLGGYRFSEYRSEERPATIKRLLLHVDVAKKKTAITAACKRGTIIAEGVMLARDLVNRSALQLYPATFASQAQAVARKHGLRAKVLKPEQLEKLGMKLILGVGAGSSRSPRLVHLTYAPAGAKKSAPVVLVGKGVTFDSGGLSLKPAGSMADMKSDMAGAAAVLATMQTIARLKPKVTVHGIMGLAENMPSGTAIRPGDVIESAAGKTIEINNTDAEGRLVLADALHYAAGLKPGRIVDLATLTGACVVALGNHTVGAFSNDDDLVEEIIASADAAGEDFWRMPLTDALGEQLKSDVADMKNTGERWGGAITAALFLREFVGDTPWTHLDIAGPATSTKQRGATTKGGTGVAVATLANWLAA